MAELIGDYEALLSTLPPGNIFVILPPNASFNSSNEIPIDLNLANIAGKYGAKPGEHYLVIETMLWGGGGKIARQLRRKWRDFGILWTNDVKSESLRFVIDPAPTFVNCN